MDTTENTSIITNVKDVFGLAVLTTAVVIAAKGWKSLFRDVNEVINEWEIEIQKDK